MVEGVDIEGYSDATLIGRGRVGAVYEATDTGRDRRVVIRVLGEVSGRHARRRFDRERKALRRLGRHPNVIAVQESGRTGDGRAYLVSDLPPGGSLQDRLVIDGQLHWAEALADTVVVARAVQAAHDEGLLHLDIRPANILLDRNGTPGLAGFGVVNREVSPVGGTAAALAHTAPEVIEGRPGTTATDIYALGSTFHTLVTGIPPFSRTGDGSGDGDAVTTRILSESPPDLRPHGVPGVVAAVIGRALARDPGARQASAGDLADQLESAVTGHDRVDGGAGEPRFVGSGWNRVIVTDRFLWAIGLVIVFGFVGGAIGYALRESPLAAGPETVADPDPDPDPGAGGAVGPNGATTSTTLAPGGGAEVAVVDLTTGVTASAPAWVADDLDACGRPVISEPGRAVDGESTTAWRVEGDGVGATLDLTFAQVRNVTSLGLLPGDAATDACDGTDRFLENRRVVAVVWTLGDQVFEQRFDPGMAEVQTLDLPAAVPVDRVTVTITESTEAGGFDAVAISEIRVSGS